MKLPALPHDKALHLLSGYVVACAAVLLAASLHPVPMLALWQLAIACPALVGLAKEVFDVTTKRGTGSFGDWAATVVGGLPLAVLLWLLH